MKKDHGNNPPHVNYNNLNLYFFITARKRVKLIRRVIAEISGRSPFERKIMELLKQSKANSSKKAYKLAKKSLGTHKRAQRKKVELADAISRGGR